MKFCIRSIQLIQNVNIFIVPFFKKTTHQFFILLLNRRQGFELFKLGLIQVLEGGVIGGDEKRAVLPGLAAILTQIPAAPRTDRPHRVLVDGMNGEEVLRRDVGKVEEEVTTLLPLPGNMQLLNERCQTRCTTDRESRGRNDKAHERIMANLAKTDERIEVSREERNHQIESLKADLIREFRKNGGR